MKTKIKRLLAVLLVLALGLTGCKEEDTAKLAFQAAPGYIQEDATLPVDTGELQGSCTDGESIWFWTTAGEREAPTLWRVPLDGPAAEQLDEYQPLEMSEDDTIMGYIGPVLGGDGSLWIWEQRVGKGYDLPEGFNPETDEKEDYYTGVQEIFQVRQLDASSGKTLKTLDITGAMKELNKASLNGMAADAEGNLYLADNKQIASIDGEGQIAWTIKADLPGSFPTENAAGTLALLPDGTIGAVTVQPGEKRDVRCIDAENQKLADKKYAVPSSVDEIYPGRGPCLFYYTNNDAIFGMVEGEQLPQRLLPWYNTQVESPASVKSFVLLEEGRGAFLTWTTSSANRADRYQGRIRAFVLQPTDEPPKEDRVKLVYGVIGENKDIRYDVKKFNRSNKEYYVEIRDYSEGMLSNAKEDKQLYQSAVARLFVDIAAGEGPDILGFGMPLEALGRQDALEDLRPWMDRDPEISRETVMDHVLECMEDGDGKLYRLCRSFFIETAVTDAERAAGRTGWTMDEMMESFGGSLPDMYFMSAKDTSMGTYYTSFHKVDKNATLRNLVRMSLDRYVDWETGECFFEDGDFKNLLRLTDTTDDPETELNLEDVIVNWLLDELGGKGVTTHEMYRIFPWEGKPILYTRTLESPADLSVDDVLFSGEKGLVPYRQRLIDSGVYMPAVTATHIDIYTPSPYLDTDDDFLLHSGINFENWRGEPVTTSVADVRFDGADGKVYASYIGFPSENGSGSSFSPLDCEAVSASSGAKEGAWEFIRRVLLPGGNLKKWDIEDMTPYTEGFAMNRADFEEAIAWGYYVNSSTKDYFRDADGKPVEMHLGTVRVGYPGQIVEAAYLMPPTEAQLERFWNLYNAIDHVTGEDNELLDIIVEQAQPYFAGDKNLDETAQLIQNRVKLYVNENR